jgi:hypothetical protein
MVLIVFDTRGRASVWHGRQRAAGPTRSLDRVLAALPADADPALAQAAGWGCRPDPPRAAQLG